jgi:hypothetical protein
MKAVVNVALVVAAISLIGAIISRFTMMPITYAVGGELGADSMLEFTNTCLFIAIAVSLAKR